MSIQQDKLLTDDYFDKNIFFIKGDVLFCQRKKLKNGRSIKSGKFNVVNKIKNMKCQILLNFNLFSIFNKVCCL